MEDGICPFSQKECMYSKCMIFHDVNGCAFEFMTTKLESIEKEIHKIKSSISSIELKID